MDNTALELIHEGLDKLEPFPHIVQNTLNLMDSGTSDIAKIANILNKDPVLTARLLSLANSPFYGLNNNITDIEDVCVILGNNIIRTILIAAGALECFPMEEQRKSIWAHSIEVATIAKFLASNLKQSPEKAYLGGLLHDIGKLLLLEVCPEHKNIIDPDYSLGYVDKTEKELEAMGITHAQVGAKIVATWNLPKDIQIMVEMHHNPAGSDDPAYASLVFLANELCHKLKLEEPDDDLLLSLNHDNIALLNITTHDIKEILPDIKIEIESLAGLKGSLGCT